MRIRMLGRCDYRTVESAMRQFTQARDADTADEIWLVEHDPVFTLGVAGQALLGKMTAEEACAAAVPELEQISLRIKKKS